MISHVHWTYDYSGPFGGNQSLSTYGLIQKLWWNEFSLVSSDFNRRFHLVPSSFTLRIQHCMQTVEWSRDIKCSIYAIYMGDIKRHARLWIMNSTASTICTTGVQYNPTSVRVWRLSVLFAETRNGCHNDIQLTTVLRFFSAARFVSGCGVISRDISTVPSPCVQLFWNWSSCTAMQRRYVWYIDNIMMMMMIMMT